MSPAMTTSSTTAVVFCAEVFAHRSGILPHQVVDGAVAKDSQSEVHRDDGIIFEVTVHDEVRVGQPHFIVVMNGI